MTRPAHESQRLKRADARHAAQMDTSQELKSKLDALRSSVDSKLSIEEQLRADLELLRKQLSESTVLRDQLHTRCRELDATAQQVTEKAMELQQALDITQDKYNKLHETNDQQATEIEELQGLLSTVIEELGTLKKRLDGDE